jgi:hypothetical protein
MISMQRNKANKWFGVKFLNINSEFSNIRTSAHLQTWPTPSTSTVKSAMNCKMPSTCCKKSQHTTSKLANICHKNNQIQSLLRDDMDTFGTTNKSRNGVRKIDAISSSNIIPVYCITKNTYNS